MSRRREISQQEPIGVERLLHTIERLAASRRMEDVVDALRDGARALIGADGICLVLRDGDECVCVGEDALSPLFSGQRFPMSVCASGRAMLSGDIVVVPDIMADESLPRAAYAQTFARSLAVAPIGKPEAQAALGAYWAHIGVPSDHAMSVLQALARTATTALGNIRLMASLSQAEQRMTRVLDSVSDAFYAIDRHWRFIAFNAAAEAYFGAPREAVLGETMQRLFPQGRGSAFEEACQACMQGGSPVRFEMQSALRPDRIVSIRIAPIQDGVGVAIADVTAQRQAEWALRDSEARFREVANAAPVLIWVSDDTKACTWFNEPWLRFTGRTLEEELGAGWLEGVHPDDREVVRNAYEAAFDQRQSFTLEYRLRRADGLYRDIEDVGAPRYDPLGRFLGYIGACNDVTSRKRAEIEAAERAAELEAVLDAAPAAIWIARDAAGRHIDGNRFARAILRMPEGFNLSKSHPEAAAQLAHFRVLDAAGQEVRPDDMPVQRAARGERVVGFEETLVFDDGQVSHLIGEAAPLLDSAGRPRGAIAAFADITSLKEAQKTLHEREQMFRTLAETIGDVFYVTQLEPRKILYVSPAFESIWGRSVQALYADADLFFESVHPEDRMRVRAMSAPQNSGKQIEIEYRIVRPDGEVRWILDRAFPVEGDASRSVGLAEDITERKMHEQRRELLIHELNHRVKNTLAVVQAMAFQSLNAPDRTIALAAFDARLQALAAAHDVLTQRRWESADLETVVRRAMEAHAPAPDRLSISGPNVQLAARSALAFSLAVHELATNAVKYGAFSRATGAVSVSWTIVDGRLLWEWREEGGPPTQKPARFGFGLRLIERGLAHDLQGRVTVSFSPSGLRCVVDAPYDPDSDHALQGDVSDVFA